MNNEEKILAILEKHGEMLAQMQGDIAGMKGDIAGLKTTQAKMQDDIAGMKDDIAGLKTTQAKMQDDLTHVKARLDYDVDERLKAINEGIDAMREKQDTMDKVKELAEETRDKVDVIHAVVSQHSAAITELKKVQ